MANLILFVIIVLVGGAFVFLMLLCMPVAYVLRELCGEWLAKHGLTSIPEIAHFALVAVMAIVAVAIVLFLYLRFAWS